MTEKRQEFLEGLQAKNTTNDGDRIFAAMEESATSRKKIEQAKQRLEEARRKYDEAILEKNEAKRIANEDTDGSKEQSVFAAIELSGTSRKKLEEAKIAYNKAEAEYKKAIQEREEAKRDIR